LWGSKGTEPGTVTKKERRLKKMMGLLSAEGYKLARSKGFYICMAVVISVVAMMCGLFSLADRIQRGELENGTGGIVVSGEGEDCGVSIWEEVSIMEVVGQIFSGDFVPCILAVFVSIFVIGEYGNGMMKNVAGKGHERWKIFLSKLLVTELASVLIILPGIGAALLGSWICKGSSSFTGEFWRNLMIFTGIQLLLEMALTAVFVLTSDICRNYAAGISFGLGIAVFPVLIGEGLDMLLAGKGFAASDYLLVSRSIDCPYEGFTKGYVGETALVAGIWFVLATGAGLWHFYRTDIQ